MIKNLQVLRAVAAYMVVFHHAQLLVENLHPDIESASLGAAGVDIFFIISGFIMVFTTQNCERTPAEFWNSRIVRIVPLYWLATFCLVALSLIGFSPTGLHGWDMSDLLASLFFIPNIRADGSPYPIVFVGWTLLYEMFFYFLFGLSLLLRSRSLAVASLTGVFLCLWIAGRLFQPASYAASFYANPITLEFAAGTMLGLVYSGTGLFTLRRPRLVAFPLAGLAIALLIGSELFAPDLLKTADETRLLYFGIPALMIVTAALILERSGVRYAGSFVLLQGAASYAIYLFHPLILQTSFKALSKVLPVSAPVIAVLAAVASIAVVCVVGTYLHLLLEKPMSQLFARRPKLQQAT